MGISGFFGRRNLMKLHVEISAPDEIYAGTAIPVKVVLTNSKRFMPSFLIKVKLGDSETLFLPVIAKEGKAAGLATMAFPRRGRHRIDDVYLSSVFPFNFFIRFRRIGLDLDVIVFPAVKKCSIGDLFGREKRSKGDKTLDKTGFEAEMLSIRNYQYGDPQKYIHWKASARTGELKTKELSTLAHRPLLLELEKIAIADLEEKISCVTYIIMKSFRLNIPVGLKIGTGVFSPVQRISTETGKAGAQKAAMLKELALYGSE
jgi:uncharacterized protein (DUF58 family)